MYKDKKVLAIVTARGGSKGLPGKNIKMLLGKPLIAWTLESAKKCPYIDKIFVSTDYQEIADVCENFGVEVPALRPAHLAEDASTSADVVEYTINSLKDLGETFDYILLLEPTSPLRKKNDLTNIIKQAINNPEADSLITLGEIQTEHPMIAKKIAEDGKLKPYIDDVKKISQRQQADKAYFPYGVAYMIKTDIFKEQKTFYTESVDFYFIERWQNYEIDDICDFLCIENILKANMEKI